MKSWALGKRSFKYYFTLMGGRGVKKGGDQFRKVPSFLVHAISVPAQDITNPIRLGAIHSGWRCAQGIRDWRAESPKGLTGIGRREVLYLTFESTSRFWGVSPWTPPKGGLHM